MQSEETKSKPVFRQKTDEKKTTEERSAKKQRVSKQTEEEPKERVEEVVKKLPGKNPIGGIIGRKRKERKSGKKGKGGR